MLIDKIITMASGKVRIPFVAMERSLRAVGCELPLYVIPYNDDTFELPPGSHWWLLDDVSTWLESHKALPVMRKYQCLIEKNYQFVDSDVVFLKNPEEFLKAYDGFVTSCTHWHNPAQTFTSESKKYFKSKTTVWQSKIFNTGQFACDSCLYTFNDLKKQAENSAFISTCLKDRYHEQPGINQLVNTSGVLVTNLTLPPACMESTWAGDYDNEYERYWSKEGKMPYLIHWAGGVASELDLPINKLFESYLTKSELTEWENFKITRKIMSRSLKSKIAIQTLRLKKALRSFKNTWMEKN